MSIDWITVAAQIANFLVLVLLLKRFLYHPILDGIDARETEITNRMQEAVTAKEQAEANGAEYLNKKRALDVAQSEMSETIRKSAEEKRDALLAEAHQRMEQEQASWQTHLDEEAHKFTTKMHRVGATALLSLMRKALIDLADETLEERMAHHLIQQIKPMAADLRSATGKASVALLTSHEPLPKLTQEKFTTELQSVFPDVSVKFDTDADQAPGLVLRMGGAQLAWTVDSYIDGLEALVGQQLVSGGEQKVKPNEQ